MMYTSLAREHGMICNEYDENRLSSACKPATSYEGLSLYPCNAPHT